MLFLLDVTWFFKTPKVIVKYLWYIKLYVLWLQGFSKNQFASRHWRKYENNFRLHQRRFCRLRSSKYSHLMLIQTFYQMLLVHKVLSKTQSAFIGKQEYFTSLYMRENHCLTTIELDVYDYIFFKWKPNEKNKI